ncbi:hypothetical protein AB0395_04550 [Streptosporangium sp. NPDC051023]|uniref:hypothetical protein n=1 Tax=Streptosporangium sp. NPDC051023 TaxID=3155410 RepID=UPI00344DBBB9
MTEHDLEMIALLGTIYPGWRFQTCDAPGVARWWALRYRPVTAAQYAAGARDSIGRSTPERLAAALGQHVEITDRVRQQHP